jgi:hypothetical protein
VLPFSEFLLSRERSYPTPGTNQPQKSVSFLHRVWPFVTIINFLLTKTLATIVMREGGRCCAALCPVLDCRCGAPALQFVREWFALENDGALVRRPLSDSCPLVLCASDMLPFSSGRWSSSFRLMEGKLINTSILIYRSSGSTFRFPAAFFLRQSNIAIDIYHSAEIDILPSYIIILVYNSDAVRF